MRAVYFEKYGDPHVLQLRELPMPVPKQNEVCVKIHATSINYGDIVARKFKHINASEFNMPTPLLHIAKITFGYAKPKINVLGSQFSGEIVHVGEEITQFKPGDQVFGYSGMKMGAYAEYICMKENGVIAHKPHNMSHEEASTMPYGIMPVQLLTALPKQSGQKVLVHGGSGGIGSVAVQLFKHHGAEVTATCSAHKMEYVKNLGADMVIDYATQSYNNSQYYDILFDVLGRFTWSEAKTLLTPNGICLYASFKTGKLFQMLLSRMKGSSQTLICAIAPDKQENLHTLSTLIETQVLKTTVAKVFPLEEAAQAHEYYETQAPQGHVVLSVG